jgi:hypothetical protein
MILAAVMTWFRTNPRNVWLIAGLVAALGILLFVYLKGRDDQAKREAARDAIAVAEAIKSDGKADDKAGAAATQAALERAETERKLTDAVASAPDSVPDAVVVQYGCEQLRQAGARVADLPACRPAGR